ncbi:MULTISPECIES: DUF2147 domain-containing protein [unclassified Rhizobium]|uniref:DUF2147 domain-containing protein n=1 Tax=unclassified Rhizobium TaxID=2613769 RepID=UPI001FCD1F84|nr:MULTISPECIES: DUF2147 domain-containing protein [unclassified Rhizobium]
MSGFTRLNMPRGLVELNGARSLLWAIPLLFVSEAGSAAADITGNWARGDGNARVRIAPCGSDICAVNTWIKPGTPKEKEGDKLVMSIMQDADGTYAGTAFDPQRDLTYKLTVKIDGDRMTTRGCVVAGLICKGIDWTRIN